MNLNKAIQFIWENARLLERVVFEYRFYNGPASRVIEVLRTYQNLDGGFGHALEPDLRAPDSHPLFVEFALHTLYECGLRDPDTTYRACDFLARHADLERGIPTLLPSSSQYPRAEHWYNPAAIQPSLDRLIGLVGLTHWQGVQHPWLIQAADACLEKVATLHYTDAHTIQTAFCLLESLAAERDVEPLYQKLSNELMTCNFFIAGTPVSGYGLTPLDFAPTPQAYCRRLFSQAQIEAHLADLASKQDEDGGWPIQWVPPGEAAKWEWRARKTLIVLSVMQAYGSL
jgi:hypothetical protein